MMFNIDRNALVLPKRQMEGDELMSLTFPAVCDHAAQEHLVANTQCRAMGDLGFT